MAVKLTKEQQEILKDLMYVSGKFADQVLHIMQNHGLDKIKGCDLAIMVTPEHLFSTETVTFGHTDTDAGRISLCKGRRTKDEPFLPFGKNSYEYELLFADEAVRSRIEKILHGEKPLPPDGLWVGADRNSDPVDGWEWDLNDSLS